MELKRILVPTDFSKNADYALQYALTFAREFGAKLYLLHVVYFPAYTAPQTLRLPGDAISQVLNGLVVVTYTLIPTSTALKKRLTNPGSTR